MVAWESMIFHDAAVNAEETKLTAVSPTTATVRSQSYGVAHITHAMAFTNTDDVAHVRVVPSGYDDPNGFEIPYVTKYGATEGFDLAKAKLPVPIKVYNQSDIAVYAKSETAADSVVFVWLAVEYGGIGNFEVAKASGALTQREADAGAALTSNVATDGTTIISLLAGHKYQLIGVSNGAVDGVTAGCVGPAFVRIKGPAEFLGLNSFVPVPNNPAFCDNVSDGMFYSAGIKMPVFTAPNQITPEFLDYTAERPTCRLIFAVDSAGIK